MKNLSHSSRLILGWMAALANLVLMSSSPLHAGEDWFCTEAASRRAGDTWMTCGIGIASTEADARKMAFEDGLREFERLCTISSDCRDHETTVEPGRTQCTSVPVASPWLQRYRCLRALTITVGEKKDDIPPPENTYHQSDPAADRSPPFQLPDFLSAPPLTLPWTLNLVVGYHASPLSGVSMDLGPIQMAAELQRRLLSRIGLGLAFESVWNASSPDELFGELSGPGFVSTLWLASLPLFLSEDPSGSSWFIAPEFGLMNYQFTVAPPNPAYDEDLGILPEFLPETTRGQATMAGVSLGYSARDRYFSAGWKAGLRSYSSESGPAVGSAAHVSVFFGFNF